MIVRDPPTTLSTAKRPIHTVLMPFPIVCFIGVLATDIAYWRTGEMMWADFSAWLLVVGMIAGALAVLAGLFDLVSRRLGRSARPMWPYILGISVVLALSLLNTLIHTRDAWTSVVPWGLAISAIVVVLMIFTAWLGRSTVSRYDVGGVR